MLSCLRPVRVDGCRICITHIRVKKGLMSEILNMSKLQLKILTVITEFFFSLLLIYVVYYIFYFYF